jgi:MoxR-like ATPase
MNTEDNLDPQQEGQEPEKRPEDQQPQEPGMDPAETPGETTEPAEPAPDPELQHLAKSIDKVRQEIGKVIIGQHEMIDLLLAALFTNGHVLMEGVPGIAKTLSARLMAKTMSVKFTRSQFTPDLMPSDIVGTNVYSVKTGEFTFKRGPVFTNVLLIDEINRAPAKTQAALFEVMEERQVTIESITHALEFPFFTIATQNPIEQEGTYKLPEAQLDRFLFRIKLDYLSLAEELQILKRSREQLNTIPKIEDVHSVFAVYDICTCH